MGKHRIALRLQLGANAGKILAIEINPPQVGRPLPIIALCKFLADVEQARIAAARAKDLAVNPVPHLTAVNVMEEVADAIPSALKGKTRFAFRFADAEDVQPKFPRQSTRATVVFDQVLL